MGVLRIVSACLGAALVVATSVSVLTALVIPRGRLGRMQRRTDRAVALLFGLLARPLPDYPARDRLLAAQGPAFLAVVLVTWLAGDLMGFALLLWPFTHSLSGAFREAGSSLLTLGFASTPSVGPTLLDFLCAAAGLVTVALQIGYLPTLYSAFSRRETEVTLLASRAGSPPWGPELLARTRVGLQAESEMTDFYRGWERWAADVAESHSNYPALIRFRSPQAYASWIVGMLAVLDSAALYLAISPTRAPVAARLVLRMGFTALRQIADAIGMLYDSDPRPDAPLQLTEDDLRTPCGASMKSASPANGTTPNRGRTFGAGGSTTSRSPTPCAARSTPSPPCGPAPAARVNCHCRRSGRQCAPRRTRTG